jgi:hypothetical protein
VAEEVSGIPGLTCREWQPGFDVTIDGPAGAVSRTKDGAPVQPAETYSAHWKARSSPPFSPTGFHLSGRSERPLLYDRAADPRGRLRGDLRLFGTAELPAGLHCCSSFMVSQLGTFAGYFWGNHNSRDNFPDYARATSPLARRRTTRRSAPTCAPRRRGPARRANGSAIRSSATVTT